MKKALQVASVASMIDQFNMENIKILQDLGYTVDVAANFDFGNTSSKKRVSEFKNELKDMNISINNLLFDRKIFNISNFRVYKQLKNLIEENDYDIIHCHSPIGGVITRLAARKARKGGIRVIYTAHGFHFFKGSSFKNWILFYPIEKYLSKYTDIIITINKEDFNLAKRKFKSSVIKYVPGIGIDTNKINSIKLDKIKKRNELNLSSDAVVLFSVGELNKNKNHEIIIRALSKIKNKNIYYIICGQGELEGYLKNLICELKLEDQVRLLGYRSDIYEINKISDIFIFPSLREGLSVALMEAMAAGLPVICSRIRGNVDLIHNNKGGYICNPKSVEEYSTIINKLVNEDKLRYNMGQYNRKFIEKFNVNVVRESMEKVYLGK